MDRNERPRPAPHEPPAEEGKHTHIRPTQPPSTDTDTNQPIEGPEANAPVSMPFASNTGRLSKGDSNFIPQYFFFV